MTEPTFLAGAVQLCAGSDKEANLAKVEDFARSAHGLGVRLLVLPEVFLWRGERAEEPGSAEPIPGPSSQRLSRLAAQLRIVLVAGSILEDNGSELPYNTSLVFGPDGSLLAKYRKLHLFDVDIPGQVTIRESAMRAPGNAVVTADTALGRLGLSICYDLRFPELYRRLAGAGARIVSLPAAFTFPTGAAHWETLVRARAIENQIYVIAADQIGRSPSGVVDFGNSMIVDPWGKVLARAADRESLIVAEIDLAYQTQVRRQLPCLDHIRLSS